jgi:GTP-binding protein
MIDAQSMSKAHVIALVVDAKEPLTKQDLALAQKAVDDGRCIVVVLNKMDAVDDKKLLADGVSQRLGSAMWQAQGVECVPVSALNNDGVEDIMPAV